MLINLSPILKLFNQSPAYHRLADALYNGDLSTITRQPLGVPGAVRPAFLAALHADLQRPILFVTARSEKARILSEQLQIWARDPAAVFYLPPPDALPFEKVGWSAETTQARLTALSALMLYRQQAGPAPLVVTSARALIQHTLPPPHFATLQFRRGQRVNLNQVVQEWVALGYQPEEVVETPGSFSRRGGILDIFPPNLSLPVRIEFFGDEIDSLRSFDPTTQRSEGRLEQVVVGPATEALPRFGPQAAARLARYDLSRLQPSAKIALEEDIARLESGTFFRGIEHYLPFIYNGADPGGAPAVPLDYLPENGLVFIEDPEELALVVDELEAQVRSARQELVDLGDLPEAWPAGCFRWSQLVEALVRRQAIALGFTPFKHGAAGEPFNPEAGYPLQTLFAAPPAFGGQVKQVIQEIVRRKQAGERLVLVSRQTSRLSHLLADQAGLTVTPQDTLSPEDPPPAPGSITLLHGVLMEGWLLSAGSGPDAPPLVTVMSDSELFGWKKPTAIRRRRPRKGVTPETFFADVNPGDLVVHIEHGIGRYIGLVKMEFDGAAREYLAVEYAQNDRLYVPIHQADRLSRYVGLDDGIPRLNRLGSADWNIVKRKAKKAVEDIARELLEIYARRETAPGHAFAPDTEWQREIEDAFPYVETEDQLRAIAEVKADMEKPRPMDRLVCGDVGYGKTEVALRAAFKAVMDGMQVAILTPTTVLAQQHYQTFTQRLADYPVQIEMLSRFRTRSQQEEILRNLEAGVIDIVIGTHRLLQKDVRFKKLGLLIIDEEQRFGVKHKEKLKGLRASVDVLTLSATPIPRTLHMALSGVRDLSTIDTPPEERIPIRTVITEYDEGLIASAVRREMDRGGQVFYVYNRVMGIEQKANRVRNLIPEARVAVAHGQMSERQLERVMIDFIAGEYDVLVCTTIIENGIDMPNVNTIIIDRADRLGLSQLYQLRGRVGRGAVQAYAYLLTPRHHQLNPDARKRLDAIAEATELGAGFRIAMRDLEIRGAGELLGAKQHGHIAAVGFDLYTRLLAQAVSELKGESPHLVIGEDALTYAAPLSETLQLNLPMSAYIPESYVPEEKMRLRLYRRLASITTLDGIADIGRELEDRFGDLPEPVVNLLYQLKLKALALAAGVQSIVVETGQIVIRADSLQDVDRAGLARRLGSAVTVTPRQVSLPLHPRQEVWQAELEKTLRLLVRMVNDPTR
ncbi:MAG: transcription-repair coupling factor [Chloroflexi bacterium]|nr:MAG: transcription-repair coupling factor [Chloroflexota bacterium]